MYFEQQVLSSRIFFGLLALSLSTAGCANLSNQLEIGEISCGSSAYTISSDIIDSAKSDCRKFVHKDEDEKSLGTNLMWTEYHNYLPWRSGFLNVRYSHAEVGTSLKVASLRATIEFHFKKVRQSAENWSDEFELVVNNEKFDARSFDLSNNRKCTGFLRNWEYARNSVGTLRRLAGYACGIAAPLTNEFLVELLESGQVND